MTEKAFIFEEIARMYDQGIKGAIATDIETFDLGDKLPDLGDLRDTLISFIKGLFQVYLDQDFAFLEINPEMSFEGWDYGKWRNAEIAYLKYEEDVKAGKREQARDDLNEFVQKENLDFKTEQATIKQQNFVTERQDKLNALEVKREQ